MKLFSGTSNKPLAEKIAQAMNLSVSPIEFFVFPDGEKRIQIQENVVEEHCVVVQSTSTPVTENYMELFFIIDGLKRSGASQVSVVMPYVGYQRQDHVFRDGEAVSLDVVIRMLESLDVERIIVLDLHSIKIPELFTIPVTQVSALPLFARVVQKQIGAGRENLSVPQFTRSDLKNNQGVQEANEKNFVSSTSSHETNAILVSPDMGGLRRISKMSELLGGMPWIATVKDRDLETGSIAITKIEGEHKDMDLKGKHIFMVDDMISSGKTMAVSAALLKSKGVKHITAFATHPIFSQVAPRLLQESDIDAVYVTDSVFVPKAKQFAKLHILSTAEMVAKALEDNG